MGSHAFAMDDVQGPIDVKEHAQDAHMLVHKDDIENVIAIITAGMLKDIHILVIK